MLDMLDLAIVLLRPDSRVMFANLSAKRLAARGDCLNFRAQQLHLVDGNEQGRLEKFLQCRPGRQPTHHVARRAHGRDKGAYSYILHAVWLDQSPAGVSAIAALRVYEPHRQVRLSAEFLAGLYGLTPMESRLAASLFDAPALQEAADRCSIGLNTAKTHLKHVFVKCGVRSKAELLRVLALGPRSA
jgi:DNA-binding CsgD family transcriptional regulator